MHNWRLRSSILKNRNILILQDNVPHKAADNLSLACGFKNITIESRYLPMITVNVDFVTVLPIESSRVTIFAYCVSSVLERQSYYMDPQYFAI